MKKRLLPELDLARLAPAHPDIREKALRRMKQSYSPYSYDPFRRGLSAIFNTEMALFASEKLPWEKIKQAVTRECKTKEAIVPNLLVAKGLYDFCADHEIAARSYEYGSFKLKLGMSISYWQPLIVRIDGKPCAVFADPRKSSRLTKDGIRFVLSVMHEHIRVSNPDFAELELCIFQFSDPYEDVRPAKLFSAQDFELFSLADLETMADETISLWNKILEERHEEAIRKAAGGGGLL